MRRARGGILALALASVALGAVAGCEDGTGAERSAPTLHVAAAASLADVMPEIARAFGEREGVHVELRFGASPLLARQIQEGAPTDAFVSADPRWIQVLIDAGLAEEARAIATNRLVAIVPSDVRIMPTDMSALAELPHLAVAGAEVPAGMHARTALERSGVLASAQPRLVDAVDVRAALAWVARGEAEAGIVYATDARSEPRVRIAFEIPAEAHEPIRYEAAAISRGRGAPASPSGRAWVAYLAESDARGALAEAGFGPPP